MLVTGPGRKARVGVRFYGRNHLQPEWTQDGHAPIRRTRCARCGVKLPEGGFDNDRKYCSQLCASPAYKSGAGKWGVVVSRAEHVALKAAQSQRTKRERIELYDLREEHWRNDYHKRLRSKRRAKARAGRQCPACGTVFDADRADAKFCSRRCQQNAWQREKRTARAFKCAEVD